MKKIINTSRFLFLLGILFLAVTACHKDDDLVTKDALTGGLVKPTKVFNYKLGTTVSADFSITVPTGPGISKIEIYSKYTDVGSGSVSNTVLLKTITSVTSTVAVSLTYADLKSGIIVNGNPLPESDLDLAIGSSWTLNYVTYMADDGRQVVNNAKTTISVANAYAGKYLCTGVFHHPTAGDRNINEEKNLVPTGVYTVTTSVGDLAANGYFMEITVNPNDNSVTVAALEGTPELHMTQGKNSHFDPATGIFYIYYYYVGATGNRVIEETYTPI